jgi:hypothetical protein
MASASPKKPLFCHSHSRSRFRHSRSPAKGPLALLENYFQIWMKKKWLKWLPLGWPSFTWS